MKKSLTLIVAMATIAAAGYFNSAAAADYPAKTVRVVSGFPAGGGTDAIARFISKSISGILHQTFVVDNRAGAGGGVAATYVKGQPADGYTILQTISGTMSSEPAFQQLEYSLDDFEYLATVVQFQEAIVTRADAPWDNLGDLLKSDKAKNGDATYGSQSRVDRLMIEGLNKVKDDNISIVPFQGGPPIIAAILGGQIDMGWSGTLHVPLIEAGKMKALAVPGDERYDAYPNAPTLTELGFPLSYNMYSIFAVPKGTPKDVVATLSAAIIKAAQEPDFLALCDKYNFKARTLGTDETTALIKRQFDQAKQLAAQEKGN